MVVIVDISLRQALTFFTLLRRCRIQTDGFVQDYGNSIVDVLDILQSSTKRTIMSFLFYTNPGGLAVRCWQWGSSSFLKKRHRGYLKLHPLYSTSSLPYLCLLLTYQPGGTIVNYVLFGIGDAAPHQCKGLFFYIRCAGVKYHCFLPLLILLSMSYFLTVITSITDILTHLAIPFEPEI